MSTDDHQEDHKTDLFKARCAFLGKDDFLSCKN